MMKRHLAVSEYGFGGVFRAKHEMRIILLLISNIQSDQSSQIIYN